MIASPERLPGICFYIHHHGSGHIMRALTIAGTLHDVPVYFMGSGLQAFEHLIPQEISCIHLPPDIPSSNETLFTDDTPSFLHYAPLGLSGQRERTALITDSFKTCYPLLLVVDVSVEITLLARLCGIPTIVIRQHGDRDDQPHLQAYESAELLIAPFSKVMSAPSKQPWVDEKTLFAGGFSKYSNRHHKNNALELPQQVAILIGEGGTSINNKFIEELSGSCPTFTFHVIGPMPASTKTTPHNVIFYGKLADPVTVISSSAIVIGNAGHNTVMEMATLNKRFICIPEDRPFEEQQQKAQLLARNGNARVIQTRDMKVVRWKDELETIAAQSPNWNGVIAADALDHIATAIRQTIQRLFKNPLA